jgi:tRNA G10  N-methylase Trm11
LTSNTGYQLIGSEWINFLRNNNMLSEKTGEKKKKNKKRRRKGKKLSTKALLVEKTGENKKRKDKNLEPDGNRLKQEIDNVCIEPWAFCSPKLVLGRTKQTKGPLGVVLLHYCEEDGAKHVDDSRASTKEPRCSVDVMGT